MFTLQLSYLAASLNTLTFPTVNNFHHILILNHLSDVVGLIRCYIYLWCLLAVISSVSSSPLVEFSPQNDSGGPQIDPSDDGGSDVGR